MMKVFVATILSANLLLLNNVSAQLVEDMLTVPAPVQQMEFPIETAKESQQSAAPFLDLNAEEVSVSSNGESGIDTDMLINFGLWLIVILCLCGLTAVGLRMLNRRGVVNMGVPAGARVIESLSLGKHRFVQLVEIGGHSVLVASDASGIQSVVPLAENFSETLLDATGSLSESSL